jgi:hypothetical protein
MEKYKTTWRIQCAKDISLTNGIIAPKIYSIAMMHIGKTANAFAV